MALEPVSDLRLVLLLGLLRGMIRRHDPNCQYPGPRAAVAGDPAPATHLATPLRRLAAAAHQLLDQLGRAGQLDWSRASLDSVSVRAKRGVLTGPNPVDRGKAGSKYYPLVDRHGVPWPWRSRRQYP
jgi:hypothetical protein